MKYPIITHGGHTYRAHLWGLFTKGESLQKVCATRSHARLMAKFLSEENKKKIKIKRVTVTWKGKVS